MKVIITMPAYNEEKTIAGVIKSIIKVMDNTKYKYSILVVDDGSKDKTAKVAKLAGAMVFSHPYNYGLAETFRTEIKKCLEFGADVIVHTDADGQYNSEDIPNLLKEIEKGHDLVLASRFLGKIEYMPFMKKIGNIAFSRTISKIIKFNVTDCQTGFRAFTREVAAKIKITSDHTYTQEQIIRAVKEKFKVKEIPTNFGIRKDGESRLLKNPFEYAFRAWINILRIYRDYQPLKFFGILGSVLITAGILIGIWLTYLFFSYGKVGHIPLTVLTMLLIVAGIQIITFGFLADMKKNEN